MSFRMIVASIAVCSLPTAVSAFECNVCHSKNPAMVKMHTALRGHNCFDCHRVGDKLMGKAVPKDRDSQIKRRQSEAVCRRCHGTDQPQVPADNHAKP